MLKEKRNFIARERAGVHDNDSGDGEAVDSSPSQPLSSAQPRGACLVHGIDIPSVTRIEYLTMTLNTFSYPE